MPYLVVFLADVVTGRLAGGVFDLESITWTALFGT